MEVIEIKGGYPQRTLQNIKESDGTLIISTSLNTPGEKLTLRLLTENKKQYLIVKIIKDKLSLPSISLQKFIDKHDIKILNIAGNSISRYKFINQEQLDTLIYDFLKNTSNISKLTRIQSGDQSGTDESAIKAGMKLGIKTRINMVKWMFRDENGNDISDKELFMKRFR
jgi:hypothetical protein